MSGVKRALTIVMVIDYGVRRDNARNLNCLYCTKAFADSVDEYWIRCASAT